MLFTTAPARRARAGRPFRPAAGDALEARLVLSHAAPVAHAAAHVAHAAAPTAQVAAAAAPVGLSPPWYAFENELKATVGHTPGVHVGPLTQGADGSYSVTVLATSKARAAALASILDTSPDFGGTVVHVNVVGPKFTPVTPVAPATAAGVAHLYGTALHGNPLYHEAVVESFGPFGGTPAVFPVYSKSVVQFYNDNIADLYSNTNLLTATAFADVTTSSVGTTMIKPSTAR